MLIYNNYVFQVYVRICPATYVPQNAWYMFLNGYTMYMYTIHIYTQFYGIIYFLNINAQSAYFQMVLS